MGSNFWKKKGRIDMIDKYILEDKKVIPADLMTWAKFLEKKDLRIVKQENVGDVFISTVFLGLDHYFGDEPHAPLIFETMIFGGKNDGDTYRCSTWEQAEEQHIKAVKKEKGNE